MPDRLQLTPEILVPRLGDYLVERQLITAEKLKRALDIQEQNRQAGTPKILGQILIEEKFIAREVLDQAITEQILQLRNALVQANEQLEQRVQQRTAELKEALDKLSELSQMKTNFVSNISHELRTPMTHLKGYLELLVNEDLGKLAPDQKSALSVMEKSSSRLERLIEDLILFSMSEHEKITLILQPCSILNICQSVFNEFKQQNSNHTFYLDVPNDIPAVNADQEKLLWVIHHLVENAVKFTPTPGAITVTCKPEAPFIVVQVSDTGIGIPANRFDEVFEPFHQLDGSSKRKYGGTGLGLSLAQKIIEAHNSRITVKSEVGKGSTFEFRLKTA